MLESELRGQNANLLMAKISQLLSPKQLIKHQWTIVTKRSEHSFGQQKL